MAGRAACVDREVDLNLDPASFAGWLPIGIRARGPALEVDWCHAGETAFTDPFFEQTIDNLVRRPFNLLFRHETPLADLPVISAALPATKLAGFIFHLSRCGSTVISRMLAALPSNLVLSEPRVLDAFFRVAQVPRADVLDQQIGWFQALVGALAQKRRPGQERCFIKFDSWHALHLPFIRRAFPNVPWLFVFREPLEVLVSHSRQPAAQMAPGHIDPRLLGLAPNELVKIPNDEYCARVLAAISRAALAQPGDGPARFVDYRELPGVVEASILPFFGLNCVDTELEAMRETARFHAKQPAQSFTPDSEAKQLEAGEGLRGICERLLRTTHQQLAERAEE